MERYGECYGEYDQDDDDPEEILPNGCRPTGRAGQATRSSAGTGHSDAIEQGIEKGRDAFEALIGMHSHGLEDGSFRLYG